MPEQTYPNLTMSCIVPSNGKVETILNSILPKVNNIRNSVMHFRPERFNEADRMEVNWLKMLLKIWREVWA